MSAVVEVTGLGLAYRRGHDSVTTLKERLAAPGRAFRLERHWALRGVSLQLEPGEVFGVVGPNGAGKSTLLKTIARVLAPTEGRVVVRGRVAPLIELGAGFHGELTGRENVILYGALLGTPAAEMRRLVEPIARWAGLEDSLDVPLRAYSTGMAARLAFTTATAIDPDILLVDEVLAVGDEEFRRRSWERIRGMMAAGVVVVLVTHEPWAIEAVCNRAMWLDHGRPMMVGDPAAVMRAYLDTVPQAVPRSARG